MPRPENRAGRRIAAQRATGRTERWPVMKLWKRRAGTQPDGREASAASRSAAGAEAITRRAVAPFCRASTKVPWTVSVRSTFIAAGLETSTSLTVVVAA